jgi:gamma-carbonic anhydrase
MGSLAKMAEYKARVKKNLSASPKIPGSAYIASGAHVLGKVVLGERVNIWPGAVLRGDIEPIYIGEETNIQDLAVLHVADYLPCKIGARCTIGHSAIIHACAIDDECLIGMGAIVLDGAVIAPQCLIGAGSLVTQGSKIPEGSLVYGSPAKVIRKLSKEERAYFKVSSDRYVALSKLHREKQSKKKIRFSS